MTLSQLKKEVEMLFGLFDTKFFLLAAPESKEEIQSIAMTSNKKTIFIVRKFGDLFDDNLVSSSAPLSKFINVEFENKAFTFYMNNQTTSTEKISEERLNALLKNSFPSADIHQMKRSLS